MNKHAIIFPGQGSQSVGMMSDLASNFPIVQKVFKEASDTLGFDLWKISQEDGTALNQTQNTQPAMLAAGYATYKILKSETNLSPICMAGHSLGEYSALVASNCLDFADGVKIVQKRAELMQLAVPKGVGAMAAILGLDDKKVIEICNQHATGVVEAVNFNSPGQVVIAGNKDAVETTCKKMKENGAKRALILPVSVPSHSSLMVGAANKFAQFIDKFDFKIPSVDILHNVDGKIATDNEIKDKLVSQLHKPVLWTTLVKNMQNIGVDTLIEAGPGKVLSGLTRRIDKNLSSMAIFDTKTLKELK